VNIDWGAVVNAGTQIATTIANQQAAKAKGRADEARISNEFDRGTMDRYATDKELDLRALVDQYRSELDRAKGVMSEYEMRLDAPGRRASNAVRGDILANVQDVGVNAPAGVNVTSFSGGLRPSLLSGNSRALGAQMSKEALLDALDGKDPTPYSDMAPMDLSSITNRRAPAQTPMQQPSGMDRVMENIAMWAGLAGTAANAFQGAPRLSARALPAGTAAALPAAPPSRPIFSA
jgi:hypothetical protein